MSEPYTFIAHRAGVWYAISSAQREPREIKQFAGKYVGLGCSITTTYSAEEHAGVMAGLHGWKPLPSPPPPSGEGGK